MFSNLRKSNMKPITHHQIDDQTLEVVRTTRKNSIALKTRADKVMILVPKHYSNRQLTKVLSGSQAWLSQSLQQLEQRLVSQPNPAKFKGERGETFEFLGQHVTLVCADRGGRNFKQPSHVCILERQCLVNEALQTHSQRGTAIETFMIQTANEYLAEKLPHYANQIGVRYHSVKVKGYKSRWGSCHPEGRLQFNWRLWQAPPWVIEYVMVHELCHLVHLNHSKAFWALVNQHYPKTAEAKLYIKQHGQRWISFLQP